MGPVSQTSHSLPRLNQGRVSAHRAMGRRVAALRRFGMIGLGLALAACAAAPDPVIVPLTLPLPDGRAQTVRLREGNFVVNRRLTQGRIELRVTRLQRHDLGYADGKLAKTVVEAYCAS